MGAALLIRRHGSLLSTIALQHSHCHKRTLVIVPISIYRVAILVFAIANEIGSSSLKRDSTFQTSNSFVCSDANNARAFASSLLHKNVFGSLATRRQMVGSFSLIFSFLNSSYRRSSVLSYILQSKYYMYFRRLCTSMRLFS